MFTRKVAQWALLAFATVSLCSAQQISGTISGTVVDPSGGAVPNARVVVFSIERQRDERTVNTDGDGNYSATNLPIGTYRLTTSGTGFKTDVRDDIVLNVSDKLTVNIALQVGQATETVNVTESASQLQLQSSEQSNTITGTQIRELGLVTRNYQQLVALMPGVTSASVDQLYVGVSLPSGGTATIPFSINGTRNSSSSWTVDGADNVDRGSNQTLLTTPSIDAIAQFKVQRSGYSAEFGRAGGGQISVVTKSGTSAFHGDLYEFNRTDALAANNFLNNATRQNVQADGKAKVPPLHYNNFGWTLGGPLYIPKVYNTQKDKTFFFVSQEFRRVITYAAGIAVTPTPAELTGAFPHPVCTAYSGNTCTSSTSQIPSIDPVARGYIQDIFSKLPAPQSGNTLTTTFRNVYNFEQELYKIDHTFGPKLAFSIRFLRDQIPTIEPQGLFTGGVALPGVAVTNTNSPGRSWNVRGTSTLSPTLVNEGGYSYSYGAIISIPTGLINPQLSPNIRTNLPFPVTLQQVPSLTFTGGTTVTGEGPYLDYNRNYNFFDNLTKVAGPHTLRFGFTYNHYQKTENAGSGNQGTFNFSTSAAQLPAGGATLFEQAFANFLVGNVAAFSQPSLDITPDVRTNQWEVYVQDDWRIRPNFTLNLGVRYSMFRQPTDYNGQLTTFDPADYRVERAPQLTAAGLLVPGTGDPLNGILINGSKSPYRQKVAQENTLNFAPRFGFAWDPFSTGKTSVRGGYGIFWDSALFGIYEQNIFANPPFVNSVTIPNTTLGNPAGGTASISNTPKILRGVAPDFKTPYYQQWSFDVQRQITNTTTLDVAYVGTKGTHLTGIVDINQVAPGLAFSSGVIPAGTTVTSANTPLLNPLRPYRGYSSINQIESWFNSNYHSLQVAAQKTFSGGSQVSVSYTWSKNLTDAQTDRSSAPQNSYNIRGGEYGPSQFDRRHVFTANYVYEVPFFRTQKGLIGKILGGWQVAGIVYAYTGLPLTITTAGIDTGALGLLPGAASARPDLVCDPNANAPGTRSQWFNTSCFVTPPVGRPGNAGRGVLRGPGFQRWDVTGSKNIVFAERFRFQLRAEASNVFNQTNPNGLGTALTTATTFGTVTSYRDPRIIQLGGKFYF